MASMVTSILINLQLPTRPSFFQNVHAPSVIPLSLTNTTTRAFVDLYQLMYQIWISNQRLIKSVNVHKIYQRILMFLQVFLRVSASDNESADKRIELSSHSIPITNESTLYSQIRHLFSLFTIGFNSRKTSVNYVKKHLIDYCSVIHRTSHLIFNCRLAKWFVTNDQYGILIYVKGFLSFSFLLNQAH